MPNTFEIYSLNISIYFINFALKNMRKGWSEDKYIVYYYDKEK